MLFICKHIICEEENISYMEDRVNAVGLQFTYERILYVTILEKH